MEQMKQRVIGFDNEMKCFNDWVFDSDAQTSIFSVSGIGGIGKTTLLFEMARTARLSSLRTLWLDGQVGLTTSGAFLDSLEVSLATEYGVIREHGAALLPFIVSELSKQKIILLIDNCEHIDRLEGWLLSSFLPHIQSASVLLVCASRNGLPLRWKTNPYWKSRIHQLPLRLFTREEVYDYLGDSGLAEDVQIDIAERTEGHPLSLALTVDLLHTAAKEERNVWREIPTILSAEFLREVASPGVFRALTVLALLPVADEKLLNRVLEAPLDEGEYYKLSRLSFVRVTMQGVSLHHVVSRLLRDDFAQRNAEQFERVRGKVFSLLAEQFHSVDKQLQMRLAAHVLELYREFLPSTHAYANFSSNLKPGQPKPFQQEDLPYLKHFLMVSVNESDWQSELVETAHYQALLEDIALHFSDGIFIVRDYKGIPLAFSAGLWLHALSMPLLERYATGWLEVLGEEVTALRQLPSESADTIFVLLSAVDCEHALYRPKELGALLMQQWLIHMTNGLRCVLASADRQLNQLMLLLGFRECGKAIGVAGIELTIWELDFRQTTFDKWIHRIIWQTEAAPAITAQTSALKGEAILSIERNDMKQILEQLFDAVQLERLPVMQRINWSGSQMRSTIQQILSETSSTEPLTQLEKDILRESYVQRKQNKNQLAALFHMSRTTFYRHSRSAEKHLAYVLSERLKSI